MRIHIARHFQTIVNSVQVEGMKQDELKLSPIRPSPPNGDPKGPIHLFGCNLNSWSQDFQIKWREQRLVKYMHMEAFNGGDKIMTWVAQDIPDLAKTKLSSLEAPCSRSKILTCVL